MEEVMKKADRRGRPRKYAPGDSPTERFKRRLREDAEFRKQYFAKYDKKDKLEPKSLHGFRFWSIETKHDFENTEKKLEEMNAILYDIPATDYSRRNAMTYKRDKLLYDLFAMIFKDSGHGDNPHLCKIGMEIRLRELCEQSGREYQDYINKFLDQTDED